MDVKDKKLLIQKGKKMNIKKPLNLLKSHKAKTIFLAGLMGLLPSCKMDKNEPEDPKSAQNNQHATLFMNDMPANPVDSFMRHMPYVDGAVFYEPTADSHCMLFHADNNTNNITGVTELRDVKDRARYICNPYNLTRVDNTSVNGSAKFITPGYWVYRVEYSTQYGSGDWGMDCVPDAEYQSLTPQILADSARTRLLAKYPEDEYHANQIYNAILNNQGSWEYEDPFYVTFNSNGWKQNLRYSDFGTFDMATLDYSEGFTSMYSGGLSVNETQKAMVQPQTFKATAFGNVKCDYHNGDEPLMIISTGRDSATFTIDEAQNETIVMPFNNWYKVTIIRTNNSVVSQFEDNNGNIVATWQLPHQNTTETGYREGVQDNGLAVKDGLYGIENQDGILTGTSVNYYTDETGYVEFVGQGYRQDWGQGKRIQFTFSFGGTNRPRPEDQITTGLENVYCAPARNGRQR